MGAKYRYLAIGTTNCHQVDSITDTSQEQLRVIQKTHSHPDPKVINDLRKRKLINMQKVISYEFAKGPNFATEFVKEETDLTADMIVRYDSPCISSQIKHADLPVVHGKT